jgi:hypothetical protein
MIEKVLKVKDAFIDHSLVKLQKEETVPERVSLVERVSVNENETGFTPIKNIDDIPERVTIF